MPVRKLNFDASKIRFCKDVIDMSVQISLSGIRREPAVGPSFLSRGPSTRHRRLSPPRLIANATRSIWDSIVFEISYFRLALFPDVPLTSS